MDAFALLVAILAIVVGLAFTFFGYQVRSTSTMEPIAYDSYRNPWRRRSP
jgi:hypothetical protein